MGCWTARGTQLTDAVTYALGGLAKLQQNLPSHPLSISEGKRAANIKRSGPVRAFFLSLLHNCRNFKRRGTVGRLEISMTLLLAYIFLDGETCYLGYRQNYIKERCPGTAVELHIKQRKEAMQAFNEQS